MKLEIYPEIILRVPQFHLAAALKEHWEPLKESIRRSSNDFYQTIKDVRAEELNSLPRPIYHSIWKYFNRSRYRATPYGSFAGFGLIKNTAASDVGNIQIAAQQDLHQFICWTSHEQYAVDSNFSEETLLFANSSYYQVHDQMRYLARTADHKLELAEVQALPELKEILSCCANPLSFRELKKVISWNADKEHLLTEMIDLQLILTDTAPNIIGTDYFDRRQIPNEAQLPQYILAERKIESGYPDKKVFRYIPKLILLLSSLINEYESPELNNFRSRFIARYESRYVRLMEALDPELGLSYCGNEYAGTEKGPVDLFKGRDSSQTKEKRYAFEKLLLNATRDTGPLRLESLGYMSETAGLGIPNSLSILCAIIDGELIIEEIGGSTATAVLGRYTMASESTTALCRSLALQEQQANPDVLFFDIAYSGELLADNINRRQQVYPYQLSILNFDTSAEPITLDDLYITSNGREIILFSKRLNKRMVPRLSTAYNYNRSDLALFRFLCDFQFQGLKANLAFRPSDLVPDLDFYPRLQYQNVILSPAKWKVYFDRLEIVAGASGTAALKGYLTGLGMHGYVLVRTDDRTLCFDTDLDADLAELFHILKKFKQFYLEEGFVPKRPVVTDLQGNGYASQMMLSVCHTNRVYSGHPAERFPDQPTSIFSPGTEWLYYEIYTHPLRTNGLLQDQISKFLKAHKSKIHCWFFVRFNKGGNHIRLRMKIKNLDDLGPIMGSLAMHLQREIQSGVVSDFKICKYERENHRYSAELIEQIEHLFFKDSRYVVALLNQGVSDIDKYRICMEFISAIRAAGIIEPVRFDEMINKTCHSLLIEHQVQVKDYKQLNQQYRLFQDGVLWLPGATLKKQIQGFNKSFLELLALCQDQRREELFTDLMHMHINRLFSAQQRMHEMIIYYFMTKRNQYQKALYKATEAF